MPADAQGPASPLSPSLQVAALSGRLVGGNSGKFGKLLVDLGGIRKLQEVRLCSSSKSVSTHRIS